jgi:hypothetical protein
LECHPIFLHHPSTLLHSYPHQRDMTLIQYHNTFLDYLQLRAFISNYESSLDDPQELDLFIHRTKHADFLNRITVKERTQVSLSHKYTSSQIVETLSQFLQLPHSPARSAAHLRKYTPNKYEKSMFHRSMFHRCLPQQELPFALWPFMMSIISMPSAPTYMLHGTKVVLN